MKFEVLYTNGVQNEVELQGHTVVVGRDPACDLVLNDSKCSRRHAIVEMGPSGLAVRDNGSANGVFVNGRKVERAPLLPGDVIRLGETILTVVAESTGTVVMAEDEIDDYQPTEDLTRPRDIADEPTAPNPPVPPPPARPTPQPPPLVIAPPPPPRAVPAADDPAPLVARSREPSQPRVPKAPAAGPVARGALPRPMTVTALATLWLFAGALYGAVGLGFAIFGPRGSSALAAGASGVLLAGLSGVVGLGLWARAPWARLLQLVLAGIGVLTCVFTLPSIAILAYMLRPEIQLHFTGPRILSGEELDKARAKTPELAFTLGIVGTLAISLVLLGVSAYVGRTLWSRSRGPVPDTQAPAAAAPERD